MLHYQRVGADTVGTTVDTKETVGTITIPSNTTNVYGILAQRGSSGTTTAAEAGVGEFFVNPRSIGIQEFNFPSNGSGGGAATNEAGVYDSGTFIPFRAQAGSQPACCRPESASAESSPRAVAALSAFRA